MNSTDSLLHILTKASLIDLGITLMKLYTYVRFFRDFLCKRDTMNYLQSKLKIIPCDTFPLLCVHLSIRNPLTSRVPKNVCMLLCARYNYPIECTTKLKLNMNIIYECAERIIQAREKSMNVLVYASTALMLLGKERQDAIVKGEICKYKSRLVSCLCVTGSCISTMTFIKSEISRANCIILMKEMVESAVHTMCIHGDTGQLNMLCHSASQHIGLNGIILSVFMRYDLVEVIKACITNSIFSIERVISKFKTLSSTKVFDWLYDEHNYRLENLKTQYFPYTGSCLHALKKLYVDEIEMVSTNIIEAIVKSDDVEALIWLRDTGKLDRLIFMYESSGITQEIISSYGLISNRVDSLC